MVRPKLKDGRQIHLYISYEILEQIEKYKGSLSTSGFIEEAVKFVLKGNSRSVKLASDMQELLKEINKIKEEKERLEKENERLKKKIEKQEEELEKWRAKWKGQTTLTKYEKKNKEILSLVEKIREHIEEGKTWREVAREAGIIMPGDQIDLLWKFFKKHGKYELVSDIIDDWKLVSETGYGYVDFVFKAVRKSSHAAQVPGEKTFVEVGT